MKKERRDGDDRTHNQIGAQLGPDAKRKTRRVARMEERRNRIPPTLTIGLGKRNTAPKQRPGWECWGGEGEVERERGYD